MRSLEHTKNIYLHILSYDKETGGGGTYKFRQSKTLIQCKLVTEQSHILTMIFKSWILTLHLPKLKPRISNINNALIRRCCCYTYQQVAFVCTGWEIIHMAQQSTAAASHPGYVQMQGWGTKVPANAALIRHTSLLQQQFSHQQQAKQKKWRRRGEKGHWTESRRI